MESIEPNPSNSVKTTGTRQETTPLLDPHPQSCKHHKTEVVIDLATTYTRHTIHSTVEGITEPFVHTSEKHPYCFGVDAEGTFALFDKKAQDKLEATTPNGKETLFCLNTVMQCLPYKRKPYLRFPVPNILGYWQQLLTIFACVFKFHCKEVENYILQTLDVQISSGVIQWVIILPVRTYVQGRATIRKAAEKAGLNNDRCRYVFPTDILALHIAQHGIRNESKSTLERENSHTACVCFESGIIQAGKHMHNYHILISDFEEQIKVYDINTAEVSLRSEHLVQEAQKYQSKPVDELISKSKYRDILRYNDTTSTLYLSRKGIQKIFDEALSNIAINLKPILVAGNIFKCYMSGELIESSYFQQRVQQECQYINDSLLGGLACKEGETVTSDYTYGHVAIENFNEEFHLEQYKTPDTSVEECAIWIFKPLIKKGQQLTASNEFVWSESVTFNSKRSKETDHQALVMRSKCEDPKSIDEKGCEVAATVKVHPPLEGWQDEVEFKFKLTITEDGPMIEALDMKSDKLYPAEYKRSIEMLKGPKLDAMQSAMLTVLQPDSIKRRATYTYGLSTYPPFRKGEHAEHLKFIDSKGKARCLNVINKLIGKDQPLQHGQVFSAQVEIPQDEISINPKTVQQWEAISNTMSHLGFVRRPCNVAHYEIKLVVEDTDLVFKVINTGTGESREMIVK
ncbi:hypothetical protein MAR_034985 [Mya arenaria]|uniref:Uncharacterized protein n=1 Tax=Mya arenaria TaxID=6604 RepID=A0ABY7ELM2_MYAAR|nr:hypothetical protein MAR_034985 [Mya arenaria]